MATTPRDYEPNLNIYVYIFLLGFLGFGLIRTQEAQTKLKKIRSNILCTSVHKGCTAWRNSIADLYNISYTVNFRQDSDQQSTKFGLFQCYDTLIAALYQNHLV